MAILQMLSVRDSAIDAFNTPFFVPHVGSAIRGFGDECKKVDSAIAQHPADYELFHLGSFDGDTGQVVMLDQPRSLARGADFVDK